MTVEGLLVDLEMLERILRARVIEGTDDESRGF